MIWMLFLGRNMSLTVVGRVMVMICDEVIYLAFYYQVG